MLAKELLLPTKHNGSCNYYTLQVESLNISLYCRLRKLQEQEIQDKEEQERMEAERRQKAEQERERRAKEEFQRKLEEMKRKQAEEEARRNGMSIILINNQHLFF